MFTAEQLAQALREAGYPTPMGGLCCDERGLCFLFDIELSTLRHWRADGDAPPSFKIGRVLFDLEDVARWIGSRRMPEVAECSRTLPNLAPQRIEPEVDAAAESISSKGDHP